MSDGAKEFDWIYEFGDKLIQAGDFVRAERHFQKSLASHPGNVEILGRLASIEVALGKHESALGTCRAAIEADPTCVNAYELKSTIYQRLGRFDEAIATSQAIIHLQPANPSPYVEITRSKRIGPEDLDLVDRLVEMDDDPERPVAGKFKINRALGKAYDDLGRFESASARFEKSNEIARKLNSIPYDMPLLEREVQSTIRTFPEALPQKPYHAVSPTPILIVGMIRSGTTLLDSMLARIDGVASAGEERFWSANAPRVMAEYGNRWSAPPTQLGDYYLAKLRSTSQDASWVVDKMPLNYRYLGLINLSVPHAKIVHLRRHPVDTAISIYTTDFGPTPPPFAFHRDRITHSYGLYLKLMAHWRKILPKESLIEVDYEDLVSNPKETMSELLAWLGITWSDKVLDRSHIEGDVNTPSRWQARQEIYKGSVGRWKNYRPWLGEFTDLLSPEELESE